MTCPHPEKRKHKSRAAAEKHLESMIKAGKWEPGLAAYPCESHWHVGNRGKGSTETQLKRALRLGKSRGWRQGRRKR
jgi:hypothetical protein